jgi:hypothetical protein
VEKTIAPLYILPLYRLGFLRLVGLKFNFLPSESLYIRIISRPILSLYLRVGSLKTIHRYLILVITCVALSIALTFATYFYSYVGDIGFGWAAWSVNRGLPLSWAVEMHSHVFAFLQPTFYPFDFQALYFSLDCVFWLMVLLLPSSLYLYRKRALQTNQTEKPIDTRHKL